MRCRSIYLWDRIIQRYEALTETVGTLAYLKPSSASSSVSRTKVQNGLSVVLDPPDSVTYEAPLSNFVFTA